MDTPLDEEVALRILRSGLRPLIIVYHRLLRFARGLLPSSESVLDGASLTSRVRLPERCTALMTRLGKEVPLLDGFDVATDFSTLSSRSIAFAGSMLVDGTFIPEIKNFHSTESISNRVRKFQFCLVIFFQSFG